MGLSDGPSGPRLPHQKRNLIPKEKTRVELTRVEKTQEPCDREDNPGSGIQQTTWFKNQSWDAASRIIENPGANPYKYKNDIPDTQICKTYFEIVILGRKKIYFEGCEELKRIEFFMWSTTNQV